MKLQHTAKRFILCCGMLIFLTLLIALFFFQFPDYMQPILCYIPFLLLGISFLITVKKKPIPTIHICIILSILTLSTIMLYYFNRPIVSGDGDLQFYYHTATQLVYSNFSSHSIYAASFPGTITYPAFLAIFMNIFGVSRFIPVFFNILSIALIGCTTFLFLKKHVSLHWAVAGGLLICLNPMLIVYATTCNAEMLFCCCIFLSFFFYAKALDMERTPKQYIWILLAACFCCISSLFRPLTLILLIAYILWILCFHSTSWRHKTAQITLFLLLFFLSSQINGMIVKNITGYDAPKRSYGWNLFVGASEKGTWNQEDANQFSHIMGFSRSPTEIQSYFADQAFARYQEMGSDILPHCLNKLPPWFPYNYVAVSAFLFETPDLKNHDEMIHIYKTIFLVYDLPLFGLALLGSIILMYRCFQKQKPHHVALILSFFLLGCFLVLMLIEIAPRYTISYRFLFPVLGILPFYQRKYQKRLPT